ncbi:uncharacterized protein E0L32_008904 [Thyridium curvatum]|uniref:FAD-binding domain-containing protein n=1 Tax=Thyridium curvatum TaxID=1093900 RepID=A0A507AK39_9PEZI|nr:uncharacterized protein E0L32_008904 [Thyridium curvatum]TPX09882.1 hypothetical protein E0L32_008904 [Thyridium curvatum]
MSNASAATNGAPTFFAVGDKREFDPENWTPKSNGNSNNNNNTANKHGEAFELPERDTDTGIKVLIIGAGFAGLTAALECWRKGHEVVGILERNEGPNYSGDLIIIQPSALEMMRYWPQMRRDLQHDKVVAGTYYYRHDGELIDGPSVPNFNAPEFVAERAKRHPEGFPEAGAVQIRRKFYRMLLKQVACLGLRVEYGQRVERYYEDDDAGEAGVVLADGSSRAAHVANPCLPLQPVVAADGIRSRSEQLMSGKSDSGMEPSGMSVYRTAFPLEYALRDEMVRARWQGRHTYEFWMGSGMHIGLYMSDEVAALGITPRDEFLDPDKLPRSENWDPEVDPDEVIAVMRRAMASAADKSDSAWHPVLEALVRTAPKGSLIHWPLLWRNLKSDWVSEKTGRIVQIGDSAHSTVPASAAGGTLALEDAVTLATCLRLAGVGDVALANRVYNLLRYERASCTQKVAFVNAQTLGHTTDWDALRKNPEKARIRYPKWLFRHDPEAYVSEKWSEASEHLKKGTKFQNTNIPPGHTFSHWTIQDIHKQIAEGKRVQDLLDGDWS